MRRGIQSPAQARLLLKVLGGVLGKYRMVIYFCNRCISRNYFEGGLPELSDFEAWVHPVWQSLEKH